ncbi:hypothetical protein KY358_03835 [Candidatus Woesearchaeota archaeon]|nr:hypothetical protein [Candidatus Woesearchaeota archaeon]
MKTKQLWALIFSVLLLPIVFAQPPTPSGFFGTATLDSQPITAGTTVDAYDPDGILCGTFTNPGGIQEGYYGSLFCSGDDSETSQDEGAEQGDQITFYINGFSASLVLSSTTDDMWTEGGTKWGTNLEAYSGCQNDLECDDGVYCNGAEICNIVSHECEAGTPADCNDDVDCTYDSCNEATDSCDNTADDAYCDDNLWCNGIETCDAINDCQAGTAPVLDDGVSCTVDQCDEANDEITHTPDDSLCLDGLWCNGIETCDSINDCQAGTPADCNDDVDCTDDSCNEATDSCDNTADDAYCDDNLWCNGIETCDSINDCQAGTAPVLDDGISCTVDQCDEANDEITHTPDDSLCLDGLWCNGIETCDAINDCQDGIIPDCDDGISCTVDQCGEGIDLDDNLGTCIYDTSSCSCVLDTDCDDGNPCTDDTCNPDLTCSHTNNDANSCNDGLYCTINDHCSSGSCTSDQRPADDGISCTVDQCDEANDEITHTPDDSLCLDGLWCNGAEYCDLLQDCQDGTSIDCGDEVSCTVDQCDEGIDLNDNLGVCTYDTSSCACALDTDCDDGNPCTDDTCNPDLTCSHTNNDENQCDDGFFCTINDHCSSGSCISADLRPFDDGISCTYDSCDEANDQILNEPDDSYCDDDLFCNGMEICDAINDCQDGTPADCNDDVDCTEDSCNEATDSCDNTASDAYCDDNLWCNGQETCHELDDCQDGTAPTLDDGISCTVDQCDEANDEITHTPDDSLCLDGLWCNGIETCDAINDCQDGIIPDCDDGVSCTEDSCDEGIDLNDNLGVCTYDTSSCSCASDPDCDDGNPCTDDTCNPDLTCSHTNNDENQCDDGFFCTINDHCSSGSCISDLRPFDDGISCTDDSCDEANDKVLNEPDNLKCDDENECTKDVCDDINGCSNNPDDELIDKPCGEFIVCPPAKCEGPIAQFYPSGGRGFCGYDGECWDYLCEIVALHCSDDDPFDGVNGLQCGAECDQDEDCPCQNECIDSDGDGIIDDYKWHTTAYGSCDAGCECTGCQPDISLDDQRCITTMKFPIEAGASIFSLPLIPETEVTFDAINPRMEDRDDGSVDCSFPSGVLAGIAYWDPLKTPEKDGSRYRLLFSDSTLYPGQGYYTTQDHDCSLKMEGYEFTAEKLGYLGTGKIYNGWNMIGAPSEGLDDFDLVDENCTVISGPWRRNPVEKEYERTQELVPGKGYFINVTTEICSLG